MPDAPQQRAPRSIAEVVTSDGAVREAHAADASGLRLVPEAVARPSSEAEVLEVLRGACADRRPITAAGGQSSTTGASVTDRGLLLSLRALDDVLDVDPVRRVVRVGAGALLGDVQRTLAEHDLFFAPDPTSEEESTVGGAIACNASGARTLRYGATRAHVSALRVALIDGRLLDLRRSGLEKNTAGYAFVHDMVDWFVGSEGTLGVVLEAELLLQPRPAVVVGLALPFSDERSALAFVVAARESAALRPRCLEYLDARAAALYRGGTDEADGARTMVYLEDIPRRDAEPDYDAWLALAAAHGALVDDAEVYDGPAALRQARWKRHAVPATMNERGARYRAAGGRKVSTDWAVPYPLLADTLATARRLADQHGLAPPVCYGHAGNGHPHQNFIARDAAELERVEQCVEATLRQVLAVGGTVSAEHGIGKLKRRWLPLQLAPLQIGAMRALKRELDPLGLLAPGNIL